MSSATAAGTAVQTYRTWIRATPEQVWDALTNPATLKRYGYGGEIECDWTPGAPYRAKATARMQEFGMPEVMVDGEVLEAKAPYRLSYTWHPNFDEQIAAEPASIVTYDIEAGVDGVTKLTITHDAEGAPITAAVTSGAVPEAGGGWGWILSDVKTLLESGEPLPVQMSRS